MGRTMRRCASFLLLPAMLSVLLAGPSYAATATLIVDITTSGSAGNHVLFEDRVTLSAPDSSWDTFQEWYQTDGGAWVGEEPTLTTNRASRQNYMFVNFDNTFWHGHTYRCKVKNKGTYYIGDDPSGHPMYGPWTVDTDIVVIEVLPQP